MVKPINLFVQLLLESIDARQNLLAELPQVVQLRVSGCSTILSSIA
jgi:hypothetical protein